MEIHDDFFHIISSDEKPEVGRVLISEPYSSDSYFARTVVLITEHSHEGTVGLILNKPIDVGIESVVEGFAKNNSYFGVGGPVGNDSLFMLHSKGDKIPNSIRIKDNLYFGGDFDIIRILMQEGELLSHEIRFFLGYSGWASGQLDAEIHQRFWIIGDLSVSTIMPVKKEDTWREAIKTLPEQYWKWLNFPINPTMN